MTLLCGRGDMGAKGEPRRGGSWARTSAVLIVIGVKHLGHPPIVGGSALIQPSRPTTAGPSDDTNHRGPVREPCSTMLAKHAEGMACDHQLFVRCNDVALDGRIWRGNARSALSVRCKVDVRAKP